jgi:hypothetical protein
MRQRQIAIPPPLETPRQARSVETQVVERQHSPLAVVFSLAEYQNHDPGVDILAVDPNTPWH